MEREVMKEEAVKRMEKLGLHYNVIRDFSKKNSVLNKSEEYGALYWLTEEEKKMVEEVEKEYNIMVYHVIHHNAEFGECYCMLYVSRYEDEWESENVLLNDNIVYAYVYNKDIEDFSEFGTIGIKPRFGGLIRVE